MTAIAAAAWAALKASRYLQLAVAVLAGWLGWQGWLKWHDHGVRKEVVAVIEKANVETAKKAGAAREKAKVPGAADRLKDRYCEGCK